MNSWQKAIKYLAMAFAIFLCVCIIGGILSAALVITGLNSLGSTGEMKEYAFSEEITQLKVDINAADVLITEGDQFKLESNLKKLKAEEKTASWK